MKRSSLRRAVAIAILALWIGGLLALWHRGSGVSDADRLAEAARRLDPATYFYALYQNGVQIGSASSAFDTAAGRLRVTDVMRGRAVVYGDSQTIEATSIAYLTRGFALDSFALGLGGDPGPFNLHGAPRTRSGVLLPSLAPVALMLGSEPRVGRSGEFWVFNPLSQRVERVTLRITAESLITVVDSARFDSARRGWVPAHSDTVRAWELTTPTRSISAWVDANGRAVLAAEPGGLTLARTAYEIATLNSRQRGK